MNHMNNWFSNLFTSFYYYLNNLVSHNSIPQNNESIYDVNHKRINVDNHLKSTLKINLYNKYKKYHSTFFFFDCFLHYYNWYENYINNDKQYISIYHPSKTIIYQNKYKIIYNLSLKKQYIIKQYFFKDYGTTASKIISEIIKHNKWIRDIDPLFVHFQYALKIELVSCQLITYTYNEGIDLHLLLNKQIIPSKSIKSFIKPFYHLIQAFIILNQNKYIHNDIKLENIIYCPSMHIFKIIDHDESLGTISEYIEYEKKNIMSFDCLKENLPYYEIWPVDRYFQYQSTKCLLELSNNERFVIRSIDFNEVYLQYLLFIQQNKVPIVYTDNHFVNKSIKHLLNYRPKTDRQLIQYFEKLDIYSLGIAFSEFFCHSFFFQRKEDNPTHSSSLILYSIYSKFIYLRDKMIEPNYHKRFSIYQVEQYFKKNILS